MVKKKVKQPSVHLHRFRNHDNVLLCAVCGREAPKVNILESSLRKAFTKKGILEYYNITKEQAKEFFIYVLYRVHNSER
jgi:hypothetical protein